MRRLKAHYMTILVVALIALLPLLAVLQYRWLGQVSQGEKERMQASLRTSTTQFADEYDREMTRAFITFQLDGNSDWSHLGTRFEHWQNTSAYPQLIRSVYVAERTNEKNILLFRFDPANNTVNESEWPEELSEFRSRIEMPPRTPVNHLGPIIIYPMPTLLERSMAIVIPIMPIKKMVPTGINVKELEKIKSEFNEEVKVGFTILLLDQEYIKTGLLPHLTKKYFSNGDQLDYNVSVVSTTNPANTIFTTDAQIKNVEDNDANVQFMRIKNEEFKALFIEGPMKERHAHNHDTMSIAVDILKSRDKGEQVFTRRNVAVSRFFSTTNDNVPRWRLIVNHRAGSLESYVASVRRRNVAISFGILLLLGVSMGMIVIATRRAQLLAKQQMEFVAGISHELRTPLAVICSAGDNLSDGVINSSDQIKRYGSLIKNEGRRLTEMVEQVLEFAGWQSGRKTLQLRPSDCAAIIDEALAACEPHIIERGFRVDRNIDVELPAVMADAKGLRAAVQNLINNAIKYSGDHRWLAVRAKQHCEGNTNEVWITVEDQGIGIPANEIKQIFEPFFRGQEAVNAQIHGSGLGLSLVKRTAEGCGGRVTVKSEPGRGSAFTIHLPAMTTKETAAVVYEQANLAR